MISVPVLQDQIEAALDKPGITVTVRTEDKEETFELALRLIPRDQMAFVSTENNYFMLTNGSKISVAPSLTYPDRVLRGLYEDVADIRATLDKM